MLQYRITTPEQVQFHYQIAGLVSRGMAWALDQLIVTAAFIAAAMALGFMGEIGFVFILLIKFTLDFGYYTYFELLRRGQTPGKQVLKIRVMPAKGGQLRFSDVMTRTMFRVIDNTAMMPFVGAVGAIIAMIDPYSRRLGDLAADTIVVRDAQVELPAPVVAGRGRVNAYAENAGIRNRILQRVTREQRDLIFDLMLRRDDLEPDDREAIFHRAAGYFRKQYNLPSDLDYLSDEQTVLNLALILAETRFIG